MGSTGRVLLVVLTLAAVACGTPGEGSRPAQDVFFLRSARGVTVVKAGAGAPSFEGPAVPSGDWSTVVRSSLGKGETTLRAVNPRTGGQLWEQVVDGRQVVKLVSADGQRVVLASIRQIHFTYGRSTTQLTFAGPAYETPQVVTLEGNFEPEAFSKDGSTLFVISYLPARRPQSYQVRQLDIATGKVSDVYTPDAHLQTAMGGTARVQTAAPDGTRMYTLYTVRHGDETYAFIHVLALDEMWAHCIDLPQEFAQEAESGTALTLSPDGDRLFVANTSSGHVAEVDTRALQVVRSAPLDIPDLGSAHALYNGGPTLYVSSGAQLVTVDAGSLEQTGSSVLNHEIRGIQYAPGSGRVYLGFRDEIAVLDPETGEQIAAIDPPGVNHIGEFGPIFPSVNGGRKFLKCAC